MLLSIISPDNEKVDRVYTPEWSYGVTIDFTNGLMFVYTYNSLYIVAKYTNHGDVQLLLGNDNLNFTDVEYQGAVNRKAIKITRNVGSANTYIYTFTQSSILYYEYIFDPITD